jgi:cytochrome c-type biogenesis protein CcmE
MTAKILVTLGVVLVAAGYLAFSSLGSDDVAYYEHVHKVTAHPEKWMDKSMQIHGYAVPGTIKEQVVGQKLERTFEIEYCGKTLPVRHSGSKPDTFKDQAETVVTGRLVRQDGQLYLQAIEGDRGISAKCPSKYEGNREAPKCDGV